ncbi:hypothetical protein GCM10018953_48690 [Streptosporangium nondiastaticum]
MTPACGAVPGEQRRERSGSGWVRHRAGEGGLDIKPRLIGVDETLVLEFAGKQDNEKEPLVTGKVFWRLAMLLVSGDVGPCVVIDDPQRDADGSDTSGWPPVGS